MSLDTRRLFTLIEMLVVIAIIALLASIIVPSVNKGLINARRTASLSNLRQIGTALNLYAVDHGRLPDQAGGSSVSVMTLAGKQGQAAGGGGASGAYGTPPSQRPLNPYLGFEDIPENGEVPIVRSPGDQGPNSWYNRAGSSYGYANVRIDGLPSRAMMVRENGRGLSLGDMQAPSRQIAAYDVGAYLLALRGPGPVADKDYWFTRPGENRFCVVFADGHTRSIQIEPTRLVTPAYSFLWTRY